MQTARPRAGKALLFRIHHCFAPLKMARRLSAYIGEGPREGHRLTTNIVSRTLVISKEPCIEEAADDRREAVAHLGRDRGRGQG